MKGLRGAGAADFNGVVFFPPPKDPPLLVVKGTAGPMAKFTWLKTKHRVYNEMAENDTLAEIQCL